MNDLEMKAVLMNSVEKSKVHPHLDEAFKKLDELIEKDKYPELEKKLGCPLDVFAELILTHKGYYKSDYFIKGEFDEVYIASDEYGIMVHVKIKGKTVKFLPEEYKKTWWLNEK